MRVQFLRFALFYEYVLLRPYKESNHVTLELEVLSCFPTHYVVLQLQLELSHGESRFESGNPDCSGL